MHDKLSAALRRRRSTETANMDPGLQQRGKVWRGESVEAVGMGFGGAVAAEQSIVEEQRHFVNRIVGGDVQGVEQVNLTIGTQLGQRNL